MTTRGPHISAERLHRRIAAPAGMVNTLADSDAEGALIKVLVDPAYWSRKGEIPREFEGYRVVVQRRHPSYALA